MENLTNSVESVTEEKKEELQSSGEVVVTANAKQDSRPATPADAIQLKVNANSAIKNLKTLVSIQKLTESGAHIGLNPKKWNPKMASYIHAKRSNNHVIDIVKTILFLDRAYKFIQEVAQNGGTVLLVGTRGRPVKELIKAEATRIQAPYVTQRWLGGTLTNFQNITKSLKKFNSNLALLESEDINKYSKKEQLQIQKDTAKLEKFYGGIKNLKQRPDVIILVDPVNDINAIKEARKLNIPVVSLANTNADPSLIDYIIPVNNNSIRSTTLILGVLIDAIAELRNEPTKVVGKDDSEIILPETKSAMWKQANQDRKMINPKYLNHKRGQKPTK
nr:30S ribosomal protein S2 [Ureaplasma canigenitalium]